MDVRFISAFVAALLATGPAVTQTMGSQTRGLAAELKHHYRLAAPRIGLNGEPYFEPGTILVVRADGIVSFGEKDASFARLCPSEFQGSAVRRPRSAFCASLPAGTRRVMRASDRVCLTTLDVQENLDTISMNLTTCAPHPETRTSGFSVATLIFHFPKGSLANSSAAKIEGIIGQVLSESGRATAPAQPANPEAVAKPATAAAPDAGPRTGLGAVASMKAKEESEAGKPNDAPPLAQPSDQVSECPSDAAHPPTEPAATAEVPCAQGPSTGGIAMGQTIDQVLEAIGSPDRIGDLGSRVIYFYPNLKVVFLCGRVSEISSSDPREGEERHETIQ